MRTFSRTSLALLSVAYAVTATAGCSGIRRPRDPDSKISLEVVLASGVELRSVEWIISGNGITPRLGTIDISGRNARAAVLITGLPPGAGYLARMTASDGATACAGQATFAHHFGQTTFVSVLVHCKLATATGGVAVEGRFNSCPVVLSRVIAPLVSDVGKSIALAATASDPDCLASSAGACTSQEAVTLAWSASGGSIAPSSGGTASFTCSAAGSFELTLTAFDGNCAVSETSEIVCVGTSCGDGVTDESSGEECDGNSVPNPGQRCSTSCRVVPQCGNGFREGAEQCDPPNFGPGQANSCDSACRIISPHCGDNLLQPAYGEQCDPPQANVCTSSCRFAPSLCGDGVVQGTEACDDGNATAGDGCEGCRLTVTACESCEFRAWSLERRPACDPSVAGCSQLHGADRLACARLVECARRTSCARADGNGQACYCGTASVASCLSGGAVGTCKLEVEAAARTTDAAAIAERFVNPLFPLGRAMNLLTCDAEACSGVCAAPANPALCSLLVSGMTSSAQTPIGTAVDLQGTAGHVACADQSPTGCVRYPSVFSDWSGGEIAPHGSLEAKFTCRVPGWHPLTLHARSASCRASVLVGVYCAPVCGDGVVHPGEDCEGPLGLRSGQTCGPDCKIIPTCGNALVEPPETCEPPNDSAGMCDASCRVRPVVCGNAVVQPGEQCDPPSPGVCSDSCQRVPRCGDGFLNRNEQCDDGNGVTGDGCDPDCKVRNVSCSACEENAWTIRARPECNPAVSGCTRLAGADRMTCESALACVRRTGCALGFDSQPCYCGTASDLACLSGSGNGVCKAEFEAAAGSTDPAVVAERFSDLAHPLAPVTNLVRCDFSNCSEVCAF